MRKIFTITSTLLFAAVMMLAGVARAEKPQIANNNQARPKGGTLVTKVELPCAVKATQLSGSNYSVKLEATNNTPSWLPQGKKIYFTFGPSAAQSMTLGLMVPTSSPFALKTFNYVANPYTPQSQGCTAYYFK